MNMIFSGSASSTHEYVVTDQIPIIKSIKSFQAKEMFVLSLFMKRENNLLDELN